MENLDLKNKMDSFFRNAERYELYLSQKEKYAEHSTGTWNIDRIFDKVKDYYFESLDLMDHYKNYLELNEITDKSLLQKL